MRFSATRLKQQREIAGVRRERLAVDIDRSYQSILKYERGDGVPPEPVINAIAESLGCSPLAFYELDDTEAVSS